MEDLRPHQILVVLLAQDKIDHKALWAKETLRSFVQAMDDQSHSLEITLHEAWQRNGHIPEILSARLSDDLAVQKDFEDLYFYVKKQIGRTSFLKKGPYSEQSNREQDAIVEFIVKGIDIELEAEGLKIARQKESAGTVVTPNAPPRGDNRKAQILGLP